MLVKTYGCAVQGIHANLITVEVNVNEAFCAYFRILENKWHSVLQGFYFFMQDTMDLPYQFSRLPKEIRKQVLDYLEFLLAKYDQGKKGLSENPYPLRGTVLEFHEPTTPVAQSDWEVLS